MSRHVVFGTGQVGRLVVEHLVRDGHDVVGVNRHGTSELPGARLVAGDASDARFTERVCAGADAVHFCLNAPDYDRWSEQFPPLQRGVLAGAASAGARLVVLDNLYAYGPPHGRDLVETMASAPTSEKSVTRTAMTEELLRAHETGHTEVVIGRASDYFGPGTTRSALGESVFGRALTGRAAHVMGDPRQPHSYSYTPDVAAALVTLATAEDVTGQVWHLPVAPAQTTQELVDHVYALSGHRPRTLAAGRLTLAALGLFEPMVREYRHTLYQFTDRWVVDDRKYRARFGQHATPLHDALAATVAWYRDAALAPAS
jgi:nucleoside-diphosphate-sugar epimerase